MFINRKNEDLGLQKEIDRVTQLMSEMSPALSEYDDLMATLSKLYALKETNSKSRVSKDTLAIVAGNLAGILMIVGHEKAHVVTSKALNFVLKAR